MKKKCKICNKRKEYPLDFPRSGKYKGELYYSPYCKPCHSERVTKNKKESLRKESPDLWLTCPKEKCGHIWKRQFEYRDGRRSVEIVKCRKCGRFGE
jgi:hypothetical protein